MHMEGERRREALRLPLPVPNHGHGTDEHRWLIERLGELGELLDVCRHDCVIGGQGDEKGLERWDPPGLSASAWGA
jgi:hypothetical protein